MASPILSCTGTGQVASLNSIQCRVGDGSLVPWNPCYKSKQSSVTLGCLGVRLGSNGGSQSLSPGPSLPTVLPSLKTLRNAPLQLQLVQIYIPMQIYIYIPVGGGAGFSFCGPAHLLALAPLSLQMCLTTCLH